MRGNTLWKRRLVAGVAAAIAAVFLAIGGAAASASPDDVTWLGGAHVHVPANQMR
jgi:hypothetical protein